jgi:hypothetical protein
MPVFFLSLQSKLRMSLQGCIVYLLLTYSAHTHKACCSDLAYLLTQNLFTRLLRREWTYVATVHSSSHQVMMGASDQLHTTSFCSPPVLGNTCNTRDTCDKQLLLLLVHVETITWKRICHDVFFFFNTGRGGRGSGRRCGWERQFNGHRHNYAMVSGPVNLPSCGLSKAEIHGMICKRMECKFAWDFSSANCIKRELRMAGLIMDDRSKTWRANREEMERGGGRHGNGCNRRAGGHGGWDNRLPRSPKVYHQRGAGRSLSPKQISSISMLETKR